MLMKRRLSPAFLKPRDLNKVSSERPEWYCSGVPVGCHTLSNLVPESTKEAGISGWFTGSTGRSSLTTMLSDSNLPESVAMRFTRHVSIKAFKAYQRNGTDAEFKATAVVCPDDGEAPLAKKQKLDAAAASLMLPGPASFAPSPALAASAPMDRHPPALQHDAGNWLSMAPSRLPLQPVDANVPQGATAVVLPAAANGTQADFADFLKRNAVGYFVLK